MDDKKDGPSTEHATSAFINMKQIELFLVRGKSWDKVLNFVENNRSLCKKKLLSLIAIRESSLYKAIYSISSSEKGSNFKHKKFCNVLFLFFYIGITLFYNNHNNYPKNVLH